VHHHLPAHLNIILPLGISYYTFEAISYLVDTYRGEKPSNSWLEYNFYIMYFPHLISGPIIRFKELSPQYRIPLVNPSAERITKGLELTILGYAYKVIIATNCSAIADPIFKNPSAFPVLLNYVAALAFTTQVYFDFMGYTHIARGISLLFNIELPLNFNHPFSAGNISNFWERWQISLTRWIRDYVFIPLGGTRRAYPRVLLNLFLVMLICGIWHGAGWRYVIWGAYYGLAVVLYFLYRTVRSRIFAKHENTVLENRAYKIGSTLLTFSTVAAACVIFRAATLPDAMAMFAKLSMVPQGLSELLYALQGHEMKWVALAAILLACCFVGPWAEKMYYRSTITLPVFYRVQMATACALACWLLSASGIAPFIYFEF
jgi:alginate O-acetyltransferase complex protein AlgI